MAIVVVALANPRQDGDDVGRGGALECLRCAGDRFLLRNGVGSSPMEFSTVALERALGIGRCLVAGGVGSKHGSGRTLGALEQSNRWLDLGSTATSGGTWRRGELAVA
jgi:hypothetical protein